MTNAPFAVAAATCLLAAGQLAAQTEPVAPVAPAPEAAVAKAPKVPMTRYTMTAGDLDGDGRAESIVYDSDSKAIRVFDYSGRSPLQSTGHLPADVPTAMTTADLDGDGAAELIVGEGLGTYNQAGGAQTDATIKIYTVRTKGAWSVREIHRQPTARPEVTSLKVRDLDGDGVPEILFACFASKYMCEVGVARQQQGDWRVTALPSVRMGAHVDAGDVLAAGRAMVVVGRPYGDPAEGETTAIGGAFVFDGEARIELPTTRGVSSVAVGDLDGDGRPEIVVGDGWHANYGKIARCRLTVLRRQGETWATELIEDLPDHIRFEAIELVDLTGDGRPEIVARAAAQQSLGGTVRVYERRDGGWRGMSAAVQVQAFACADFDGDGRRELVFAGAPPLPMALGAAAARWDDRLGAAVETRIVDAASLVSQRAPALQATEWVGTEPLTLAGLEGKVVLLDFWSTWCRPCIAMYPELRQWVEKYGPQGLVIVGITNHSSQTSAKVRAYVTQEKLPWPVAIDPDNATHRDYGVSSLPHTFLIDRQGVVRFTHVGGGDLGAIEAKLQELLAEPAKAGKQR